MVQGLWQEFLTIIREEVGSRVIETWFKAVRCIRWDNNQKIIYLEVPNSFVKEWLTLHYQPMCIKHLARLLNESHLSIVFVEINQHQEPLPVVRPAIAAAPPKELFAGAKSLRPAALEPLRPRGMINTSYLFDSFVVGPSNKLAFSAALAVAEKPGRLYNPLFIYGPSGLGKTHLLHAIGNKIREHHKKINILYQSADRFVTEFINAIRFDKIYHFEAKYKDIDVLLVDDIQFISNKEQTQEAFFHIFNTLHQAHKQIVFTSDSLPCDIAGLAERMRSRLEGGLIADIQSPSLETKIAILQKKAALSREELPEDVAAFIASQGYSNVRELEGALIRVLAHSALTKQELSLELAQKIFQQTKSTSSKPLELMSIAEQVMSHCSVSLTELRSARRDKELSRARHIAMYLMKKHSHHSLKEIGNFLARKDHTTVLHAFEKITEQRTAHREIDRLLSKIEQELGRSAV